jgi:hypothetical protein
MGRDPEIGAQARHRPPIAPNGVARARAWKKRRLRTGSGAWSRPVATLHRP